MGGIGTDLEGGIVEEGLADLRASVTVLALVLLVWMTIPAAGALWLGRWLRAEVGAEED